MKKYAISRTLVAMTLLVIAAVAWLLYIVLMGDVSSTSRWLSVAVILLLLLPVPYIVLHTTETADQFIIRKLWGSKTFSKSQYAVQPISQQDLGFTLRLCGSSAWVFWGYFRSAKLGNYFAQHMGEQNLLLLTDKSSGKRYVIDAPAGE